MAGLDRKVFWATGPEDYKVVEALKSCFYRSFITSLWCGVYHETLPVRTPRPVASRFFMCGVRAHRSMLFLGFWHNLSCLQHFLRHRVLMLPPPRRGWLWHVGGKTWS